MHITGKARAVRGRDWATADMSIIYSSSAPVVIEPASFNRPVFSPARPFVRYEMYVRRSLSLTVCCKC